MSQAKCSGLSPEDENRRTSSQEKAISKIPGKHVSEPDVEDKQGGMYILLPKPFSMLTFKSSGMPFYKENMKKNRKRLPLKCSGKKRAKLALQRHTAILHQTAKKNVQV